MNGIWSEFASEGLESESEEREHSEGTNSSVLQGNGESKTEHLTGELFELIKYPLQNRITVIVGQSRVQKEYGSYKFDISDDEIIRLYKMFQACERERNKYVKDKYGEVDMLLE